MLCCESVPSPVDEVTGDARERTVSETGTTSVPYLKIGFEMSIPVVRFFILVLWGVHRASGEDSWG